MFNLCSDMIVHERPLPMIALLPSSCGIGMEDLAKYRTCGLDAVYSGLEMSSARPRSAGRGWREGNNERKRWARAGGKLQEQNSALRVFVKPVHDDRAGDVGSACDKGVGEIGGANKNEKQYGARKLRQAQIFVPVRRRLEERGRKKWEGGGEAGGGDSGGRKQGGFQTPPDPLEMQMRAAEPADSTPGKYERRRPESGKCVGNIGSLKRAGNPATNVWERIDGPMHCPPPRTVQHFFWQFSDVTESEQIEADLGINKSKCNRYQQIPASPSIWGLGVAVSRPLVVAAAHGGGATSGEPSARLGVAAFARRCGGGE
ncbi:hypothetical protein DFH09DRAFT_1474858 [Mycena vulgaris]|nr:hypothetical protein DFH09DRAFT_1474858 [Mycena vulgaris]